MTETPKRLGFIGVLSGPHGFAAAAAAIMAKQNGFACGACRGNGHVVGEDDRVRCPACGGTGEARSK